MPKEVFELDKDERWQARLDEARARREIALREKASGKPQKPRPKPWEVEGASVEEPPEINPVIQERGDDKFDFADRLETLREAKADKPEPVAPVAPVRPPEPAARKSAAPEARARPQPSLVLPGAPDVAELAQRYAATLETPEPLTRRDPTPPRLEPRMPKKGTATLVALPTVAKPKQELEPERVLTRAERRRGVRPLGMAIGLLALAALPLTTEAPELEVGPGMPAVATFRIQPALGITWSLAERPALTSAPALMMRGAPTRLEAVPFAQPTAVQSEMAALPLSQSTLTGTLSWRDIAPVKPVPRGDLTVPDAVAEPIPIVTEAPQPLAAPSDTPISSDAAMPVETFAPEPGAAGPALPDSQVGAPPRPATLQENVAPTPPAPRPAPSGTVVEAETLRVTILAPARVARSLTEDIASNIQSDGHELVRIRDVDFNISARNVRYFHEADRAAAASLAERYDAELRDFTWFRPQPLEGTAELWLAGRAPGSGNTNGRVQPGGSADRGDLLERVFDRLGLGTELPNALPGADALRSVLPGGDN